MNLPFHLLHRMLANELRAHLSDAATAETIDWHRLTHVARDLGYDLDVELALIASGPTPRAALRRLAISITA